MTPTNPTDEYNLTFVIDELENARIKHPPLNSYHEAYAVLLEEVDEFWDECRMQSDVRMISRAKRELAQVAAVAIRAMADLDRDD